MPDRVQVTFVIPCFNEAARLRPDEVRRLAASTSVHLLLVDDGSTDSTLDILSELEAGNSANIELLAQSQNVGKAEAVRRGMVAALAGDPSHVGYADADFATPVVELRRLVDVVSSRPDVDVAMGARVALLGRKIERSVVRHFAGRIFATISSLILGIRVYDTQCGAKVFRVTPALRTALQDPFSSRWAFDVELLGRILSASNLPRADAANSMVEIPLAEWSDVAGSHMGAAAAFRSGLELLTIGYRLRVRPHLRWPRR